VSAVRQFVMVAAVLLAGAACGTPEITSASTSQGSPTETKGEGKAYFVTGGEGVMFSIGRISPRRFSVDFTVQNSGTAPGRPECKAYIGTSTGKVRGLPIVEPGSTASVSGTVQIKRLEREIDGDITCR